MKKRKNRYVKYLSEHKLTIAAITLLTIVTIIAELVNTEILSRSIDLLSNQKATKELLIFISVILIVEIVHNLCNFYKESILLSTKASIIQKLHWDLARQLANSSSESVGHTDPVVLSEKMREGNNFVSSIYGIYVEFFALITGLIAFAYTALHSWQIAILFSFFFILILFIQLLNIKRMIRAQKKARSASDQSKKLLVEIIQGFQDIKVQSLVNGLKPHFSNKLENEITKNKEAEQVIIKNNLISSLILGVYKISFISLGAYLVLSTKLSFASFVALYMYKNYIYNMVFAILKIAKNKATLNTSIQRMDEIFKSQTIQKEKFGQQCLSNPSGSITIKNLIVDFYKTTRIIDNISLEIPHKSFIGIVGDSGCGKSTLLKVLSHQITPSSGEVLIDGINLTDLDECSVRKAIRLAPQTSFLFELTIKQNLLLANPNASDDDIWKSLELVGADDFVRAKGGLDAMITTTNISGGERQRIALARLILGQAKILLLDECTSALDGISQEIIINSIKKIKEEHTVIMVAHRIQTLKESDQIIVMEDGKIHAIGTYSELYENNPKFRRLADLG